jgi:hypothetical protein
VEALLHWFRQRRRPLVGTLAIFCLCFFILVGCQKHFLPEDPRLKPIQEMLNAQVPIGTPEANVSLFLNSQGYPLETSYKPGTLVAIIRKIDIQRLEPVTARVTFYFDAREKLTSVELQRTMNAPVQ